MIPDDPSDTSQPDLQPPSPDEFQAAIDDILADTSMSDQEKALRLDTLRQEFVLPDHVEHDPYRPIEAQLSDAIAMLAEGGHLYRPGITDKEAG
ncbi:hypothetical protein Sa4125_34320 [Aureimonas sp. SA4125]|uniref:hypothetical protein n=1 Tax=Aureimonas sp. SA4125 TaxID=2826993 RepID=UPI001CC487F1|nr:hypothetical protein [Aureimonas sp. SA4125]BDA85890.1 hypothetical protein Sa4125_34320 [Aureimonas sp. SA4125]